MDYFEIGMRFASYKILMNCMEEYSRNTQSRFWKRDARTISASRSSGVQKFLHPSIVYYEIKFSCIYGGLDFKSKGKNIRIRNPSLKMSGCPAYLRFKASEGGDSLQLVAMNMNHNHDLTLPVKHLKRRRLYHTDALKRRKCIQSLQGMESVEIEQEQELINTDDDDELESTSSMAQASTDNKPENVIQSYKSEKKQDLVEVKTEDAASDHKLDLEDFKFTGLIAPVFTPFNDDMKRSLNLDVIPKYAKYLADAEIGGVLVNGTSGEGTLMTVEERKNVTERWAQVCLQTKQHLMVQIGGAALPDVLQMARHAEEKGANSLLCLPELYHKPQTADDLIRYLQIIAEAAPNTPLLYYHIPSLTNVNIDMGKFLNEIGDRIPTFKGIKFTSTMLDEGIAAVKAQGKRFTIFLGADTIMAGAYALGFDSAIATTLNIFPEHGQFILQHVKKENIEEARCIQDELNGAIEVITKNGSWVPSMKTAMNVLTSIHVGPTREPHVALTQDHIEEMNISLKKLGIIQE